MKKHESCVCCSGRSFSTCCEPFLSGKDKPRSIKQLMRSRYAAYALGGYADYLRMTWHPRNAGKLSVADLEGNDYQWKGLEILESLQKGELGRVEFKATFSDKGGPDQVHHERSAFARHKGQWYYLDGEVSESV